MNQEKIARFLLVILIILFSAIAVAYVLFGHVEFDEGFNLQIPASLISRGSYSTTYDGGKDFDPVITTGPTVLLPIYIVFLILEIGLYQSRFIILLYFVGMLLTVVYVSNKLSGVIGSVFSLLLMGSLPFIFYFGLRILGEIPAVFFFLLGLIFLERERSFIGGIFFGMSVLTKFTFLIIILPIFILFILEFLSTTTSHRKSGISYYLLLVIGFVLPNFVWELVKVITLGIAGYEKNLRELLNLFISNSGIRSTVASASFLDRIDTLSMPFTYIPPALLLVILLLIFLHNTILVWNSYRRNGWTGISRMHLFLVVFSIVYLFWFLISANAGWWRHVLPGFILITILFGSSLAAIVKCAINYFLGKSTEKNLNLSIIWSNIAVTILIGFVFIIIEPAYAQSLRIKNELNYVLLKNQIELANKISALTNDGGLIGYWGWWQSPEISFLSQSDFFNIDKSETVSKFDRSSKNGIDIYVLIAPAQRALAPEVWQHERFYCGELIHEMYGYQLFKYVNSKDKETRLQYLNKRGEKIKDSKYTFEPDGSIHSYSGTGIYVDGWMARKAIVWLKREYNHTVHTRDC